MTEPKTRDHNTPVSAALDWLPVHYRILYKTALFVFIALNSLASAYEIHMLFLYTPSRSIRSDPNHS